MILCILQLQTNKASVLELIDIWSFKHGLNSASGQFIYSWQNSGSKPFSSVPIFRCIKHECVKHIDVTQHFYTSKQSTIIAMLTFRLFFFPQIMSSSLIRKRHHASDVTNSNNNRMPRELVQLEGYRVGCFASPPSRFLASLWRGEEKVMLRTHLWFCQLENFMQQSSAK